MIYDEQKISAKIEESLKDSELSDPEKYDIAFHMTDWLQDLEDIHSFCAAPQTYTNEQVEKLLLGFLIHVPAHVAAASKLMLGFPVTDVFGVGAVSEKEEDDSVGDRRDRI